jgi:chromosome segregation ATPase
MQVKRVAMMVAAGCAMGILSGCGIPEEEHNAMIAQMAAERAESEDQLNGKIADLESVVKSEKAKVRTARIELDDATERIKGLQQKSAETAKALATEKSKTSQLESDLATSKSTALAAQDQAMEAESKYNTLDVEHQELKRRFEMFQSNLSSLNTAPASGSSASPSSSNAPAAAPKTDSETAKSLLDQMSTM